MPISWKIHAVMLPWLVILMLPTLGSPYKILGFFPFPASSHHNVIAPVLHELASRGHQVVYLTPVLPKVSHPNLDVRQIKPFLKEYLDAMDLPSFSVAPMPLAAHRICSAAIETAHFFWGDPEAQRIIHSTELEFDAVLMESALSEEPASALIHKFNCVGIELATLGDQAWLNELSGLPDNPAYQMDFKTDFTHEMNFWERLKNFYSLWSVVLVNYYHLPSMERIMDQYFNYTGWEGRPPLSSLLSNRSIVLISHDILSGYPFPLPSHAKLIGGVGITPNRTLPKDLQEFLDDPSQPEVILFSMGSNLNTSDITTSQFGRAFLTVFERLPYRVIMKWETNDVPHFALNNPRKYKTVKWLPQQEILAHERCKLFITHGGLQSLTETLYYGVPVLAVPYFADQMKNAAQVRYAGYGVTLRKENVTVDSVSWALQEVLNNSRYLREVQSRSQMFRSKRVSPREEAAFWVEFGIRFPNMLTPQATRLSFIQLHQIDIYIFLFSSLYLTYKILCILANLFTAPLRRKDKKD